jgi:Fic family protein
MVSGGDVVMTAEHPPLPDEIATLAPRAGFVWSILIRDGPLTRPTLQARTGLSEATLHRAVNDLADAGYLTRTTTDCESCTYVYEAHVSN